MVCLDLGWVCLRVGISEFFIRPGRAAARINASTLHVIVKGPIRVVAEGDDLHELFQIIPLQVVEQFLLAELPKVAKRVPQRNALDFVTLSLKALPVAGILR
jgi:hypothetical protein